jgi:trigger factor
MPMKKEMTRLENSAVRLDVTVPKDDFRAAYDKAVDEIARTIQIPGFRKGKVPRSVVERKLGAALHEDVLNGFVGETVKGIFEDEAFPKENMPLAYSEPEIVGDFPKFDLENDLQFAVKWDVVPQVTVETWKGFTAEIPDVEFGEADLARELDRIRERNAIVKDRPPEEAARPGDVVTVNYVVLDDEGGEIAATARQGFVFTIGSYTDWYRFDDDVAGMKVGETKTIAKNFPEDYETADLAGKSKNISVTVTAIKEKLLPDLDDDLAQDVHEEFQTLDDLKRYVREECARSLEARLVKKKFSVVMEKIIEKNPVEVPESMVRYETNRRIRQLAQDMGVAEDKIEETVRNKSHAFRTVVEGQREVIIKSLQASLIIEKLVSDLKIEVTDEDRNADLEAMAKRSGTDVAELKEYYASEDRVVHLNNSIAHKKVRDLLLKENTVLIGAKKSYEAVMEGTGE